MNNSLFLTFITLYALILLYFPSFSLQFIFSPIILTTLILLLYLLRLGAAQKKPTIIEQAESDSVLFNSTQSDGDRNLDSGAELEFGSDPNQKPDPIYADSFVEWDVRAPLEVIYEEYEGEDADENDSRESQMNIIKKYASLSLFYPESDGDASSEGDFEMNGDWDSPRNMCFRWEDEGEDDREGLIEIALDDKRSSEGDEENLIEIDLSPAR